jgi:succinate dehydrogenase / fumarate reductase, cytochrome b subunit
VQLTSLLRNSIVQKLLAALSGLLLVAFAIFHLLGNLWLVGDQGETFNLYAASLNRYPIVHGALEILLGIAFGTHMALSIAIAHQNRLAQPQSYIATAWWRKLLDRSMVITGPLLLIFLVVHLRSFRLGPIDKYQTEIAGFQLPDWQSLVADTFQQTLYAGFYVLMMFPLAIHLRHGIRSAGQSWGIASNPIIDRGSWLMAIFIASGFAMIPAWIYFQR